MTPPEAPVMVYGAAGHTGRFVLQELRRRGWRPVLSGRTEARLREVALDGEAVRPAVVEDSPGLDRALAGCAGVINCAGPFLDTAEPLIAAALRARVPYLDVTAEQASAQGAFARFAAPAQAAGVPVAPAVAFYGGLGDLLATVAMGDWAEADEAVIAIALDSWRPTEGTRATGRRNTAPRVVIRNGRLEPLGDPPPPTAWDFGGQFGRQEVVEVPFTEAVLIARHLTVSNLRNLLMAAPLAELRDPSTPPPSPADGTGRSAQTFRVECEVRRGGRTRRAAVSGRDIYAVSAPLVVEALAQLLSRPGAGVFAPGEILNAADLFSALSPGALAYEPPVDG